MPKEERDPIMDIVNNDASMYQELENIFIRWYRHGTHWKPTKALAVAKATRFAGMIGQEHSQKDIREAAKEILEDYENFKKYHEGKLQQIKTSESDEAKLVQFWDTSLHPDVAAQAKHYEEIVRRGGIHFFRELIPAPPAVVKAALEQGDYALETIPAEAWLQAATQIPYLPGRELSPEEKVEALKHVARWHYGI